MTLEIKFPREIHELIKLLQESNFDSFVIGGYVRDFILKKKSYDLDFILVDEDPFDFCLSLEKKFVGKAILLDADTKTSRFVFSDEELKTYSFDFTGVLKEKLNEDFKRRDFTINALAFNLKKTNEIIDQFSGLSDLNNKIIRAIELKNFFDDPLRMLRAFRFAALLNGTIEVETYDFIKNNINKFENIAGERIAVEIWKILELDNSSNYLKSLADIGLLEKIFPELIPCRKIPPNDHHHLNLFDHSVYLLETFENNFKKIPEWAKIELSSPIGAPHSPSKKAVSKLGSLLHDIGKPSTWEIKNINGKEKHTFYGHDKVGANLSDAISERLKFSSVISKTLSNLINHHLRPFQLSQKGEGITQRALYRFFRDLGDDIPILLMLALADHYATLGPNVTNEDLKNGEILLLFLFEEYEKYKNKQFENSKKKKLLNGNEIMEITGLSPSEKLGDLIKELDELIGIGEITTKELAIDWIKKRVL